MGIDAPIHCTGTDKDELLDACLFRGIQQFYAAEEICLYESLNVPICRFMKRSALPLIRHVDNDIGVLHKFLQGLFISQITFMKCDFFLIIMEMQDIAAVPYKRLDVNVPLEELFCNVVTEEAC